jgi:hypothetical protein
MSGQLVSALSQIDGFQIHFDNCEPANIIGRLDAELNEDHFQEIGSYLIGKVPD